MAENKVEEKTTENVAKEVKEEKQSVFRKSAIDRISSPEQLDDYLQVTGPGTFIVLGAIIVIVLGFVAWGFLGRLDTSIKVAVVSSDDSVMCLLPEDKLEEFYDTDVDQKVNIGGKNYSVRDGGMSPIVIQQDFDKNIANAGELQLGQIVQPVFIDGELPEGIYTGKITVETVSPISFILN